MQSRKFLAAGLSKDKYHYFLRKSDLRSLSINFVNYGIYQVINHIIPLITIPYIVRIIGVEKFGIISLAQAVCYYFWIITDYGYSVSGVQYIAQSQSDSNKNSEILRNIFSVQIIIMFLSFLVLVLIIYSFSSIYQYKNVFLYSFIIIPANILIAQWFYIGIEKIKFINYITSVSRIIYVVLIFTIIRSENDFTYIPLINSLSILVAGLYSINLLRKRFEIRIFQVIPLKLFSYLKKDFSIFVSMVFINLYRNSNIIILGLFATETAVGIYSAAEKIIKAIQSVFTPITQVLYPYISRIKVNSSKKGLTVIKKLLVMMAIVSGVISFSIIIFSENITLLAFGQNFTATSIIMRVCGLVIFLGTINYIVGIIFMTNYSMKGEFSKSVIITGILNIVICSALSIYLSEVGAGISFLLAELILLSLLIYYSFQNRQKWFQLNEHQ
jgi:PST family polysaccharide transporter